MPDAVYLRTLERERLARRHAESLLESRSRELFEANERISQQLSDLTAANDELQRAHGQLCQNEKLASVGQLAAGVAHEINNPIAYVESNLRTLADYAGRMQVLIAMYEQFVDTASARDDELGSDAEVLDALRDQLDYAYLRDDLDILVGDMQEGIGRVSEIVTSLRTYSRSDGPERRPVDIPDCIESALKIAEHETRYRCEVVTQLENVPAVDGYGGQLNQVFLNLVINAAQACDEDGRVEVTSYVDGDDVVVTVSDNGCGIPAEHLEQVFSPFYTTKAVGEGTGLGLSVSYAIVEEHGGRIMVDSQPGAGTRFSVHLPFNR